MTTSTTLRLPDVLKAEADSYASTLGISLNALCAVALRDYLDARRLDLASVPAAPAPVVRSTPAVVRQKHVQVKASAPAVYAEPSAGVYAPCPCGSGSKWKWCHGMQGGLQA